MHRRRVPLSESHVVLNRQRSRAAETVVGKLVDLRKTGGSVRVEVLEGKVVEVVTSTVISSHAQSLLCQVGHPGL